MTTNDEAAAKRAPQKLTHNGAIVQWLPYPWSRWKIEDCYGGYQGMRPTYEVAMSFAATLPGSPQAPQPVPPVNRSLRGTFVDSPGGVPSGRPIEETNAVFDYHKPARVRDPFAESRAKSQRQYRAHDAVYGKHMR